MPKILKSLKRVNFQDCDPLKHLNNLSYIQYFINTREDQLMEHKIFDLQEHAIQTGNSWVVVSHNIKYVRPAFLGDLVEIWSRTLTYESSNLLVEFFMFCPETKQLKALMHSRFAYYSIRHKKVAMLDSDMQALVLKSCIYPQNTLKDFSIDDRVSQIKLELA